MELCRVFLEPLHLSKSVVPISSPSPNTNRIIKLSMLSTWIYTPPAENLPKAFHGKDQLIHGHQQLVLFTKQDYSEPNFRSFALL